MEKKKPKKVFLEGPISPDFIANSIAKHQSKTSIGAHDIFLGQIREDVFDQGKVVAIDYSAYEDMAEKEFHRIREGAFDKFDLTCMHIYHSLGRVNVGEISLFVFVSSAHRKVCFEAIEYLVEEIKNSVPIFGKELLDSGEYLWKENK